MTTDGERQLARWYMERYSKRMPKKRLETVISEAHDALRGYTDAQVTAACSKWLAGDNATWPPFARELSRLIGNTKPEGTPGQHRKAIDCDGFVYDLDTQEILYSPYWKDDDPRLARYWESCAT